MPKQKQDERGKTVWPISAPTVDLVAVLCEMVELQRSRVRRKAEREKVAEKDDKYLVMEIEAVGKLIKTLDDVMVRHILPMAEEKAEDMDLPGLSAQSQAVLRDPDLRRRLMDLLYLTRKAKDGSPIMLERSMGDDRN